MPLDDNMVSLKSSLHPATVLDFDHDEVHEVYDRRHLFLGEEEADLDVN